MKTFEDLEFSNDLYESIDTRTIYLKQAAIYFENGYGVNVVGCEYYDSNGIDTYELCILRDGNPCYDTYIADDVMGYLTKDEVTEVMAKVQNL